MTLKNRIKYIILTHCKGSNTVFADRINISTSTIQSWDDQHLPKGDTLQRIHKEFNVDINWLLTGEGEPYIKKDREEILMPGMIAESLAEYEERAPVLGQAVDMLATIFGSGNQVFAQAVMSSLRASSDALNIMKQRNQQLSALVSELNEVRKRLAVVEEKLQEEGR